MDPLPRLTSEEAAARLGIKVESLYAYVSRGLLERERTPTGSTFDPLEVEAFAAERAKHRTGAGTARTGHVSARPLMMLDTDIALIEDDELYFRGRAARVLAREHSFEQVASWIWEGDFADHAFPASQPLAEALQSETLLDRLGRAIAREAAQDPLRYDLDPAVLAATARRIIAAEVGGARGTGDAAIAARLWNALAPAGSDSWGIAVLEAALILLIDHDLAVSTLAARAAASARASVYGAVQSALGAMDSALHGNASRETATLLHRVIGGEHPRIALSATVAETGRAAPGFGQPMYGGEDPRATAIFDMMRDHDAAAPALDAVAQLAQEMLSRAGRHPNIDLALAAFTISAGMADDCGPAIFAIGRTVGWTAHAMNEYRMEPLRFRPQGRYTGPT